MAKIGMAFFPSATFGVVLALSSPAHAADAWQCKFTDQPWVENFEVHRNELVRWSNDFILIYRILRNDKNGVTAVYSQGDDKSIMTTMVMIAEPSGDMLISIQSTHGFNDRQTGSCRVVKSPIPGSPIPR